VSYFSTIGFFAQNTPETGLLSPFFVTIIPDSVCRTAAPRYNKDAGDTIYPSSAALPRLADLIELA
jgi:hypothetical protein